MTERLLPRVIDPAATFESLVSWVHDLAVEKNAPGLLIGISGTDSILTFLICAEAYKRLGKPDRVMGVHYGRPFPPPDKTPQEIEKILKIAPSFNWVSRQIIPWLKQQAPDAALLVDNSIDYHDDYARWATLFKTSLNGAKANEPLPPGQNYWVVGTRNATETALGAYSNISGAVSLQPILHVWKSEVLALCRHLGVPQVASDFSRQVDCDCGRYDIAAEHIEEVDAILMARQGLIPPETLDTMMDADLRARLDSFVDEQFEYGAFKREIPYKPSPSVVQVAAP